MLYIQGYRSNKIKDLYIDPYIINWPKDICSSIKSKEQAKELIYNIKQYEILSNNIDSATFNYTTSGFSLRYGVNNKRDPIFVLDNIPKPTYIKVNINIPTLSNTFGFYLYVYDKDNNEYYIFGGYDGFNDNSLGYYLGYCNGNQKNYTSTGDKSFELVLDKVSPGWLPDNPPYTLKLCCYSSHYYNGKTIATHPIYINELILK